MASDLSSRTRVDSPAAVTQVLPSVREDGSGSGPRPPLLRDAITAVVAVVLLARLGADWTSTADRSRAGAAALVLALLALLAVIVLAVAARRDPVRRILDWVLLAAGVTIAVVEQRTVLSDVHRSYPSDEGRLVAHAIAAIHSGRNFYGLRFPDVTRFAGNTPLFGGRGWQRFGYPPLMPEVGAALGSIWTPLGTPAVVGGLGLLATAVIGVAVLPPAWRALSIVVVLGLTPLTTYAVNGHPVMLALPLLCLACAGWTRIGRGGRLGRSGWAQAACVGLAAAAQQLAWFPILGLFVAVWLVQRGPLGDRRATMLLARFAAGAVAVFVLVSLPFMVLGFRSWASGVLSQFVGDHAVASGQGLVALSVVLRGQGGAFGYYSLASGLMLLGLLLVIGLCFRRVAPLVPVLLTLVFLVGVRSQAEYVLALTPVWIIWLAGSDPAAIDAARALGSGGRAGSLLRGRRRGSVAALALLPAFACVAVAVASPGPMQLTVLSRTTTSAGRVDEVVVSARNTGSTTVSPHFYLDPASHLRSPWRISSGPHRLRPGRQVTLTLRPALLGPETPTRALRVWALSDAPETMSSTPLLG